MSVGHLMTPVHEMSVGGTATGAKVAIVHEVTITESGTLTRVVAVLPVAGRLFADAVREWNVAHLLVDQLPAQVLAPDAYASLIARCRGDIARQEAA